MSTFLQLHLLTAYPPANLNRDDLGRPKTAIVGGRMRLRVSSQSLKRAWRVSDVFQQALGGENLGMRTKEIGLRAYQAMTKDMPFREALDSTLGLDRLAEPKGQEKKAFELANKIADHFGKAKGKDKNNQYAQLETEQMVHISDAEIQAVQKLLDAWKAGEKIDDKLNLLRRKHAACDIAMFGRMIAAQPVYNTDAAVQVAHAFSVDQAAVEDDFFTAVDDLNRREEDAGAGHMGIQEFGSGLYYLYVCVNRDLLVDNLDGDEDLARESLRALARAACTVAPTGKQNSFASRANAAYVLAERGAEQPRSLSLAFLDPIKDNGEGMLDTAVNSLRATKRSMDEAYGPKLDTTECYAAKGEGSMAEVFDFLAE
ncbi:type I-E CRISPR-associated protein Cas7/Cse4/CasC [Desulfohalovibrio reitneri]|uniref:type I-E CRISPR-associated protein Cas7/Cse4/CasC n=1 Tax=Desulfohalovibrio reitneri TaxID=1307759 RepID=UPI0004A7849E|nr:type I-E CRISPR-associated protein Cas7/Cse4/CasC [Desulfohalovibrio reitneri]